MKNGRRLLAILNIRPRLVTKRFADLNGTKAVGPFNTILRADKSVGLLTKQLFIKFNEKINNIMVGYDLWPMQKVEV